MSKNTDGAPGSSSARQDRRFETSTGILERYKTSMESEPIAGTLLIIAAAIALVWANLPWRDSYHALADVHVGPAALGLNLSLSHWASDGLLAIFFFVVGMELKTEFVTGSLRDVRRAAVPILAAVCGMLGPIAVYVVVQLVSDEGNYGGWAIPVATDIAFALAVLAVFGKGLPAAARVFLMTLAVVDDLLGITLIALFFSSDLSVWYLLASLGTIAVFAVLVQRRVTAWWVLWPVGILAWVFMLHSGVHATIAGVLLGMTIPAIARPGEDGAMTHRFVGHLNVWSAGVVLPIFAFFASGVSVVDAGGLGAMLTSPVAIGVYLGLPLGKLLGIWGGTALMVLVLRLRLGDGLRLTDVAAVALVAGVGFTVSLLIATLSFPADDPNQAYARVAVLLGSLIAALAGGTAVWLRSRHHNRRAAVAGR